MADSPDVQQQQPVAPSPEQQETAATAGPQATPATDTAPTQEQPTAAAPTQAAPVGAPAPAAAPSRMQQIEQGSKHVLGEIFQTLAGGKKAVWTQTPNGPVKTYEDLKPGEMARGILAAAITGLASGYDPANRGKGPAMSSAFAGGVKGEQERQEKQATTAKNEAQEQFVNKNAADELLMKKQRFATEQQASMQDYAKTTQMMDQSATRAKQEGIVFDQQQRSYFDAQDAKYTGELAKGGKPIDDPKNPGQPLTFWDKQTAQQYANEHGKELVAPGEFDTKIMLRPDGAFVVMKTPLAEKEKRSWRFAEMDPKNPTQPKMKDGKVVPSGQKDQSGNVIPPTIMSGEDYGNKVTELDAHAKSSASAQDLLSQAAERRAIAAKDAQYTAAQNQFTKSGNDPNAVDISNGAPIVSDKNRGMLVNQRMTMYKAQEAAWQKAQKEFADLSPDQQTPEKRLQIEVAGQQTEELRKEWNEAATVAATPSQNMTRSLLKRFDNDPQKAAEYFDKQAKENKYAGNLLPQDIDTIRKNLIAANAAKTQQEQDKQNAKKAAPAATVATAGGPPVLKALQDPATKAKAIDHIAALRAAGKSDAEIEAEINNAQSFEPGDKLFLINQSKGLNDIRPGMTMLKDPKTNKTINVSNDDTKQFTDQGYQVVGRGTNPNDFAQVSQPEGTVVK